MGCQCSGGDHKDLMLPNDFFDENPPQKGQRKSVMTSAQKKRKIQQELTKEMKDINLRDVPLKELHQYLVKHVHKIFVKYDQYQKGFLDREEFVKLLKENTNEDFSKEQIDDLVERIDINRNKLIEENQLLILYENLLYENSEIQRKERKLEDAEPEQIEKYLSVFVSKIFNKYDTYEKGFLDKEELKNLLKQNTDQNFSQEQINELIVRIDKNKNELIEEKELLAMYQELYFELSDKKKQKQAQEANNSNSKGSDLYQVPPNQFQQQVRTVVHKIFQKYDGYGKGFLDRLQFLTLLKQNTDAHFTEDEIEELVNKVDTNHNNLIEQSQLFRMYKEVLEQKYMSKNQIEEESR